MIRVSTRMAVVLVCGCGVGTPPPVNDDGGQSGVANHPPFCQEDSRIEVVDPTVPAYGFDFAASDVLDALVGTWRGEGELVGGGLAVVDLTIVEIGPIEAVLSHLEDDGLSDGPPVGAPSESCAPIYEIGLDVSVAADPYLFGDGSTVLVAHSAQALSIGVEVPRDSVTGTLQPPTWENPELWDRELLSIGFQSDGTTAGLDLGWWAINDDAAGPTDTGTGSVSTGATEPSGTSAPIVTLQGLQRL